jgi:hypothetical protein
MGGNPLLELVVLEKNVKERKRGLKKRYRFLDKFMLKYG